MTALTRLDHAQNQHLTFKANTGVGRHGWLRLTPAYSVRLVRDKITHLHPGSIVTDPFSGTGTTPLAAAELGHMGQSIDVNPFLTWLGTVKTTNFSEPDLVDLIDLGEGIVSHAREAAKLPDLWAPDLFKIDRWWNASNLHALRALRFAIDKSRTDTLAYSLTDIALCRVLIARSNAAFNHQSMSFKDAPSDTLPIDIDEFEVSLQAFAAELADLIQSARLDLQGSAKIVQGDSKAAFKDLKKCDLLLTSPPYVNRMSYIRELRPYMYWLRFLDVASDAGELDWKAIGGTWGTATSRLHGWRPSDTGTPVDDEMDSVRLLIAESHEKNGVLLSNYVGKYFHDMWDHFKAALDHVKPGGQVSYIIGNSTFYGNVVPAERWYARMLSELGFEDVKIETIRKRNSNKALYEFDVTGTRP